jgi:serine/threonine protein kinase/Tfp pilus assembly protein PilF
MPPELDSDTWRELSSLFDEVLALPPEERGTWLAGLASRNAARHDQLLRLIRADAGAESEDFLGSLPPVDRTGDLTEPGTGSSGRIPGDVVGPYRLVRELGRGGMGTVWLAERADGTLKRSVALKLPHLGIRDRALRDRFDRERDILAALNHPKIARLYDAGVTRDGQPFLALEYVSGEPIGAYCDRQALGLRPRIALFLQVLDAIQFAHRNLVVHRDIKPSNVLVNSDGAAMLLDFGIAKLLDTGGAPSEASDATELDGSPMTPRYASPEQVGGDAVTTSSDVYSLGVMLFELLSGRLPYRGKLGSRIELQTAIASGNTIPPSRAADASAEPPRGLPDRKRLSRALKGDLDGIVLKALERDPSRRYPSAEAFARDLTRYLQGEPVEARPYSRTYRARKFVRRHRIGVGIAAAVTLAILGSLAFALVQMQRAQRQRDRAASVSSFLVDLFKVSDPNEAKGKTVTAREILDRGVAKIDQTLADEPLVQSELLRTMGDVYQNLGLYNSALPLLEKALALDRRVRGSDDFETMESMNLLATLLQNQGELDKAEALFREALERRRRVLGNDHADTLNAENNLALVLQQRGKLDDAEALFRESLEGKRRTLKADDPDLLSPINNLGNLLKQEGKYEAAKPYLTELAEKTPRILGEDDPHTLTAISNLGLLLEAEGNLAEAEPRFRKALEGRKRVLGNEHPQTLLSMNFLGDCLREEGRLTEAQGLALAAFEGLHRVVGPDHPRTLAALNALGRLRQEQGQFQEAERCYREVVERRRAKLGADHSESIESLVNLGSILERQGKLADAETLDREAVERGRRALGEENFITLDAMVALAGVRTAQGHADEAEPVLAGALAAARKTLPATAPEIGHALLKYGRCLTALGRYREAEAALLESSSNLTASSPVHAAQAATSLAELYARWGKQPEAAEWRKRAGA